MRIVQLTSNVNAVSPNAQKAICSHVAWLSNGLVDRGNEVHLFASKESETKAELHGITEELSKLELPPDQARYYTFLNVSRAYEFAQKGADIIHSHFTLLSSFFSPISSVPTLVSVHSPIDDRMRKLAGCFKTERYVSFSLAQRKQAPELNWYANIYHGVDMNVFKFNPDPEDYFLYLGRITEDKGVHFAIEAAKAAGVPLKVVGTSYPGEGYWQKHIEPHIDGVNVRYLGEASFDRKIELFQGAKALLFPTMVSEAFGYSMIEAMACGTPVIGFNNGSVPEIIQEGVSGFVVENAEEMAVAIGKIDQIDRLKVRKRAELYFSVEKMISGYQNVYKRIIADQEFHAQKKSKRRLKESVDELVKKSGTA